MSDYYCDDPVTEQPSRRKNRKSIYSALALLVGSAVFLQTTLASNISLSSSGRIEFGQGVQTLTACSGNNPITVKPVSTFVNASGSGAFYFTSVTVSGVPVGCAGSDFIINAYGPDSNSGPLPIFNSSSTTSIVYYNSGNFLLGRGGAGSSVTSGIGTFTVTFTTPEAVAVNVNKITLQSSKHTPTECESDGICTVGEQGPGSGIVIYYNAVGFKCGAAFSTTGSPAGGLCHYLEVAQPTWSGYTSDPWSLPWATNTNNPPSTLKSSTDRGRVATEVGLGYYNSIIITNTWGACSAPLNVNSKNASGSTCPTQAAAARAYTGGGYSDWYLPTLAELNLACQYARSQVQDPTVACSSSGTNSRGGFYNDDYMSSSQASWMDAQQIYKLHFGIPQWGSENGTGGGALFASVRPFRAF